MTSYFSPAPYVSADGPFAARYVTASTSLNFTASIGDPKSKRIVVVFSGSSAASGSSGSSATPTVTINGITATLAIRQTGTSNYNCHMHYAVVPTGTVANIAITNSGGGYWVFAAYVVENYKNPTPMLASTGGGFTTHSTTISHPTQGFLMAFKSGYAMGNQITRNGVALASNQSTKTWGNFGSESTSLLITDNPQSSNIAAAQAMSLAVAVWS